MSAQQSQADTAKRPGVGCGRFRVIADQRSQGFDVVRHCRLSVRVSLMRVEVTCTQTYYVGSATLSSGVADNMGKGSRNSAEWLGIKVNKKRKKWKRPAKKQGVVVVVAY